MTFIHIKFSCDATLFFPCYCSYVADSDGMPERRVKLSLLHCPEAFSWSTSQCRTERELVWRSETISCGVDLLRFRRCILFEAAITTSSETVEPGLFLMTCGSFRCKISCLKVPVIFFLLNPVVQVYITTLCDI